MSTVVADHIESLLEEIAFASEKIAHTAGDCETGDGQNDRALVEALETARRVLENALSLSESNGVPKMAIEAA